MEFGILSITTLVQLHFKILAQGLQLLAQTEQREHMECQFNMSVVSDGNSLSFDIYAPAMHSLVTSKLVFLVQPCLKIHFIS